MPTVLLTGAARGLGLDFTRQYAAKGWKIHACARKPEALKGIKGDIHPHPLEVTDYKAVKALAKELSGEAIDVLICNAGVGGNREQTGQILGAFDPEIMRRIFDINAVAPLIMAEAFIDHVARSRHKKLIALTSSLASLANNDGGRYAYRASKTALNMEWNCLAKELGGRGMICVALHPGWVKTDMGGSGADIDAQTSVSGMRTVIERAGARESGHFYDYTGKELPW